MTFRSYDDHLDHFLRYPFQLIAGVEIRVRAPNAEPGCLLRARNALAWLVELLARARRPKRLLIIYAEDDGWSLGDELASSLPRDHRLCKGNIQPDLQLLLLPLRRLRYTQTRIILPDNVPFEPKCALYNYLVEPIEERSSGKSSGQIFLLTQDMCQYHLNRMRLPMYGHWKVAGPLVCYLRHLEL